MNPLVMKRNWLLLVLFMSYQLAIAQSGLHVKWLNDEVVIYYDRGGIIWEHHTQTDVRKEVMKGSQPAPHPKEPNTYALRKKVAGKSGIFIVNDLVKESIELTANLPTGYLAFHPIWSTDGLRLAFHAEKGAEFSTLYIYDYYRQKLKPYLVDMKVGAPSFFSNGDLLVSDLTVDGSVLIRFDPESGKQTALYQSPHKIYFSDPTPDERSIVFTHAGTGNQDIWSLNLKTGELTQLTNTPYNEFSPRWSPSGMKLAYFAEVNGHFPAFIMNLSKGSVIQLTD